MILLPFPLNGLGGEVYIDNRRVIEAQLYAANGPTKIAFDGDIIPSKPITAAIKVRNIELNNALKARLPKELTRVVQSLGLTGRCDLDASAVQDSGGWRPHVKLHLLKGTVTHERFPVTVRDVEGELICTRDELTLDKKLVKFEATGRYAGQKVESYGTITNPGPEQQADIVVRSKNLPMDDEALAACPVPVMRAIQSLRLKGRHDLYLRLTRQPGLGQKYEPELIERVYDASLNFTGFPFAIDQG